MEETTLRNHMEHAARHIANAYRYALDAHTHAAKATKLAQQLYDDLDPDDPQRRVFALLLVHCELAWTSTGYAYDEAQETNLLRYALK